MKVIEFLIENGADINAQTKKGETALYQAILQGKSLPICFQIRIVFRFCSFWNSGHLEIIKFLIERNADVNANTENKETALHLAARKGIWLNFYLRIQTICKLCSFCNLGHAEVVQKLIHKDANIFVLDVFGKTPAQIAEENGNFADY